MLGAAEMPPPFIMNFAPIHNHTEYSALDGLASCEEIAQRCIQIGCSCCGISDHGTVSGHLEFARVMQEHEIKPIFACELYHGVKTSFSVNERDQAHFVAGALDDNGLRNLWRLVDASATNFRFVSRVNWDLLKQNSEGLFATSACIQGLVQQGIKKGDPYDALNRYLDIYKDNFYIELHTYPMEDQYDLNHALVQIAQERGIPMIYATDAHFAFPEQYETHDAYVAMQTGQTLETPLEDRKMWHPKSLFIQDEAQIRESLSYLPESVVDEALRNSGELADRCTAMPPEVRRHLPTFIPGDSPWLKSEKTASQVFLDLISEGIEKRYGDDVTDEIWGRALQETEVFLDAGLEHYFLQAWDFCKFCDSEGIKRGPGRGSAAGALVSYLLGITDVDPIKYGLIFERFYNPGREKGFPDIDNDFPVKDRKRVRDYLSERWGEASVRSIGTITRMKPKGACDRTYKVFGISFQEKEELKKIIDTVPDINILDHRSVGWSEESHPGKEIYVMNHVGANIADWIEKAPSNRQGALIRWVEALETFTNRVENYGIHPSGVVVADCDLADELPCRLAEDSDTKKKVKVTMFPMNDVDSRMFVKQDLLGLANLDILDIWEKQSGNVVKWSGLENEINADNPMWDLLQNGLTLGIFQIEDGYGRTLCKQFYPRSIEELGAIVAINRPGPTRAGVPEAYQKRKNGEELIEVDHPILDSILESTYGLFIYQEQVMGFFNALGYSLGETDAVRKILGKKRPQDLQALKAGSGEWDGKGYYQMSSAYGIDKDAADKIWQKIEGFAKYSFNKSHAISYAVLAFRTLYAKYTAPAEFIIAGIRVNDKKPDRIGKFVSEARRMGIPVSAPDILKSNVEISTINESVTFGLVNVKGVGYGTAEYIAGLRDAYDISTPDLFKSALASEKELWEKERDEAKVNGLTFNKMSPNMRVKSNVIEAMVNAGLWDNYINRGLALPKLQEFEKQYLNVILSDECDEILMRHADILSECDSYSDLNKLEDNDKVTLPGVITSIIPKKTKKDSSAMGILTIEMDSDEVEFVVFPRQWSAYKFLWKERTTAIFTIRNGSRGFVFEEALKLV